MTRDQVRKMIDFRTKYGTSKDLPWLDEDQIIASEARQCLGVARLGEPPLNDERIGRLLDMARNGTRLFCGTMPYDVLRRLVWDATARGIPPSPNLAAFADEVQRGKLMRLPTPTNSPNWKRNHAIAWTASELVAWHGMTKTDALLLIGDAMGWTPATDDHGNRKPPRIAWKYVKDGGGWQGMPESE